MKYIEYMEYIAIKYMATSPFSQKRKGDGMATSPFYPKWMGWSLSPGPKSTSPFSPKGIG